MTLEQRQILVNWQVAPTQIEIANYDHVKIKYREEVENKINSIDLKRLRGMVFYTISTNVMCADKTTTPRSPTGHVDPIYRDTYYPLEICLVRSKVSNYKLPQDEREFKTLHWIINPGQPPADGSRAEAKAHMLTSHKIDYEKFKPNDVYVESDLRKIVKEINAFIGPGRTVYSRTLEHCRQDLGCLKWLNSKVHEKYGNLMKPINVYSLEDLFIALNRRLFPTLLICQGLVRWKFEIIDTYDEEMLCRYHRDILNEDPDACTKHCAMAVAVGYTRTLIDEMAENMASEFDDAAEKVGPAKTDGY